MASFILREVNAFCDADNQICIQLDEGQHHSVIGSFTLTEARELADELIDAIREAESDEDSEEEEN